MWKKETQNINENNYYYVFCSFVLHDVMLSTCQLKYVEMKKNEM